MAMQSAVTARIVSRALIALLIAVSLLVAATIGYARARGLSVLSVQTGSMRPALRPGDAVLVREGVPASELQKGDIITFRPADNPGLTITHRIIATDIRTGRFVTKGDSASTSDRPIVSSQIVGRVERSVPAMGWSFDFLRRPAGLVVLVYAPALVVSWGEIQRLSSHFAGRRYRLYAYRW